MTPCVPWLPYDLHSYQAKSVLTWGWCPAKRAWAAVCVICLKLRSAPKLDSGTSASGPRVMTAPILRQQRFVQSCCGPHVLPP